MNQNQFRYDKTYSDDEVFQISRMELFSKIKIKISESIRTFPQAYLENHFEIISYAINNNNIFKFINY